MRLPEDQIKQAILHPEHEVRLTALMYFAEHYTADPSIMPLVIQAVEKYGGDSAFSLLRSADDLPQTPPTVEWLINQLRRDYDLQDVREDNHRFAVALVLYEADPELLVNRHDEIMALPAFPVELRGPLDERLRLHFADWPTLWMEFERLGWDSMRAQTFTQEDVRKASRLRKAMQRHREQASQQVMRLLRRQYKGGTRSVMEWMEPQIVELAGDLRLEQAIPNLMALLYEGQESVIDEIGPALGKIGTDSVIETVKETWWKHDDWEARSTFTEALEHIHSDESVRTLMEFLRFEEDFDIAYSLGYALMGHFASEAIDPVRELVQGKDEELEGDQWDLRWRLIATATIMGIDFPEYRQWHQDALATDYGRVEREPFRLADNFREEEKL